MPHSESSSGFFDYMIRNQQVLILSSKLLFLLNIDTLVHRSAAKEYRFAVLEYQKVSGSSDTL